MRVVLVSSRYGAFTGFPAWSLELRRGGGLRPGWEEEWGTWYVWGLGFSAIFKQEPGFTPWGRKRPPKPARRVVFPLWGDPDLEPSPSGLQEVSQQEEGAGGPSDPQHTPR